LLPAVSTLSNYWFWTIGKQARGLGAISALYLKEWVDPGLAIDKIIIDTGGIKNSYPGPPESTYHGAGLWKGE